MLKTIITTTLKLAVAALLIAWLLRSGKLDLALIAKLKDHPVEVLTASFLCVVNIILVSYRWKSILKARSTTDLPLSGMMKVSWIGQFFSSVLPGSVSGDLVKMLYIQKFDPSFSKKFIFASILIDRVMGLSGLVLLVGMSSLLFKGHILENAPAMEGLLNMNYLLAVGILVGLGLFWFFHGTVRSVLVTLQTKFAPTLWEKIIGLWDDLTSIRRKMVKAVLVSIIVQLVAVIIFWSLIYPFVGNHMDFVQALAFIPIGLMTLALPIAPSGLGVGHAIFQKLFEYSGIDNGASLFNLYFVVTLLVNVFGSVPYLMTRTKE